MGDKDAGVTTRFGVNPDHWLGIEVLRGVSDQAVLPDHDNEVVRLEAEPVEVAAFSVTAAPVHGDGCPDLSKRVALCVVPSLCLSQATSAGAQEEFGLPSSAVAFEKLVELRATVNNNHAGDQRHLKIRFVRPDLQELR